MYAAMYTYLDLTEGETRLISCDYHLLSRAVKAWKEVEVRPCIALGIVYFTAREKEMVWHLLGEFHTHTDSPVGCHAAGDSTV